LVLYAYLPEQIYNDFQFTTIYFLAQMCRKRAKISATLCLKTLSGCVSLVLHPC